MKLPQALSVGEETFLLHMRAHKLSPVREYQFHPTRKWRFDFAFVDAMLAVEIEGGTRANGAHSRHKGFTEDCEKYNAAAKLGWLVLRYTTEMVKNGDAINDVCALMFSTKKLPVGW